MSTVEFKLQDLMRMVGIQSAATAYFCVSLVLVVVIVMLYMRMSDMEMQKNRRIARLRSALAAAGGTESFSTSGGPQVFEEITLREGVCGGSAGIGGACDGSGPMTGNEAYAWKNDRAILASEDPAEGGASSRYKRAAIRRDPAWVKANHPDWFRAFPDEVPAGYVEQFTDNRLSQIAQGVRNN